MHRLLPLFCLVVMASPVPGQEPTGWPEQKCAVYAAAWDQVLESGGADDMNYGFIAGNENFIASGCTERGEICPQSTRELDIANTLTLALMNAGTASTFLPFRCPQPEAIGGGYSGPGL